MPWCPVCKNEYREGIALCAECKVPLVDSLEEEAYQPFIFGGHDKMARLQEFLRCAGAGIETKLEEDGEDGYRLSVLPRDRKGAVRAVQVFLSQEAKEETLTQEPQPEEAGEETRRAETPSFRTYRNSAAQAEDNRSSGYTLLAVGGAGFAAVLLIFCNVVPLYRNAGITKYLVCGIMGAMFILFIVFGILSMRNSKILLVRAKMENSLQAEITKWCEENLNSGSVDEGLDVGEGMPEEQKYFVRTDRMKQMIGDKFMNLDEAFLEHFVDEYYQRLFEGR